MGFEPTTSAVTGRRSNQLSHRANPVKTLYPQNQIPKIFHPFFSLPIILAVHISELLQMIRSADLLLVKPSTD